jgi:hypothetical protein
MCKHICECHFPNLSLNALHLMDSNFCDWAGTRGAPLQFLLVRWYLLYPSLLTYVFEKYYAMFDQCCVSFFSGTYLLCPPRSSPDEPVHEIRRVCRVLIWKWCPFVNVNSNPRTATAAFWSLQFHVLLLRCLVGPLCSRANSFCGEIWYHVAG